MNMNGSEMNHDIIPPHLAVEAMRDNGYKNAAYAIAELIDNAVQANASQVEVLCGDRTEMRNRRVTTRIHQIAVLDNGDGMDAGVLRMALQFGNGTRLEEGKRSGIGRFGMGLPSSSISQCKRVETWTWQNGINSAIYSYLDLDDIGARKTREVPEPEPKAVPDDWRTIGSNFGHSGTLVVWSNIDKCAWSRSDTIIRHSELLIGRIYRRFLGKDQTKIRFLTFDVDAPDNITESWARPNDPLYLMHSTSCPDEPPFVMNGEPMFVPWGERPYEVIPVIFRGETHRVKVRYSYARNEVREGHNPGERSYGTHAKGNLGISIMRSDRELYLDSAWTDPSNSRDRWWGIEIDFSPTLDDFFGVTNNKQEARHFSAQAKNTDEDFLEKGETFVSANARLSADEDPEWAMFVIASRICKNRNAMRRLLQKQTAGKRTRQRAVLENQNSPEASGTQVTKALVEQGQRGRTDEQEQLPEPIKHEQLKESVFDYGIVETEDEADKLAATITNSGFKYRFETTSLSTPGFFDVLSKGGVNIIALNTEHPAYEHMIDVLESDLGDSTEDEVRERLNRAWFGLRMLLIAWARYEDVQPDGKPLQNARDARWDWGRMAREFLDVEG